MVAEAEKFIAANASKPFFLYLPFIEPHVAMHPPVESVNRFPKEWDSEPYRGENGYLPHPRPRAGYAAMISDLDGYVGRVLQALDDAKLADRTLVVFSSDNGTTHDRPGNPKFHVGGADPKFFNSTRDLRGYKGSVYEGGIRVPMIARLPGKIPAGTTNDDTRLFRRLVPDDVRRARTSEAGRTRRRKPVAGTDGRENCTSASDRWSGSFPNTPARWPCRSATSRPCGRA